MYYLLINNKIQRSSSNLLQFYSEISYNYDPLILKTFSYHQLWRHFDKGNEIFSFDIKTEFGYITANIQQLS
jgi:hypothetical protein